jgi:hypothetical protein
MKRSMKLSTLVLVPALALTLASPVRADPPEVIEADIFTIFQDLDHGLYVLWNISRDDFCTWLAEGFEGPAPVGELVTARLVATGKGALVGTFHATGAIELWQFDEDADFVSGPCHDIDDQTAPAFTGTATVTANDNDLDVSLTRVNAFGEQGQATLQAVDGSTWHYSWVRRAQIDRDGEVRNLFTRTNLHPIP